MILLEDVYKQGVAGEVVAVAPGFARNFLIPRGLAVLATPGMMRQMENLRKQAEVRRAEREKQFSAIAEQIEALHLYYPVRASETGKLYGSVTPAQIAESIQEETGVEIDRRRIGDHPLRELGDFQVPVRLDAGLTAYVTVTVFREGKDPRLQAAPEVEAEETPEAIIEEAFGAVDIAEEEAVEAAEDEAEA
ncbi:MAG: 50S ribosomal protein L9 [Anaerolineae bacterium]